MALATVSQTVTPKQAKAIVLSFFTVILPEKNSLWHSQKCPSNLGQIFEGFTSGFLAFSL
ncbi:hypothetical protein [Nostoc sp.]|uniref:hypothetical protein n=1 Tax=Nostoc sp. TaxID=1180 RepID=UPI002FF531D1